MCRNAGLARDVSCLVDNGELQDLEDGEFGELASIGIDGVQKWLAAVQQSERPLQAVSCTKHTPSLKIGKHHLSQGYNLTVHWYATQSRQVVSQVMWQSPIDQRAAPESPVLNLHWLDID